VEQRLTASDDRHALALEKLGGEISRISDQLSDRIAQSERRSQQALDDIARRLSESSDKIEQRYDRASGELAERMRMSEERTARLLADARDSMEQRADRAPRRAPPLESPDPAPWTPAETASGDWRATAFADPVEDWSVEPVMGDAPTTVPDFASRAENIFGDPLETDLLETEPKTAAPFGRVAADAWPQAASLEDEDLFGGADVSDILNAAADQDADRQPFDLGEAADVDDFSAELDFVTPQEPAQEPAAASTRDVLEAARAAMAPEDEAAPRQAFGLAKRGGKSKLQERLDKQAGRQSSTMRTALGAMAVAALGVVGGYATLQVAGGSGLTLPGGFTLAPTSSDDAAPAETTAPIAALALDAAPTDAVPSPDAAATEGAGLFARAVQMLDNGDEAGVEPLIRAANLGYAPAQLRLAMLYQDGQAGLTADPVEARAWARRAAEGGEAKAMHHYAMQLYDGVGGAKSGPEALAWLKKAAAAGRVDSQYNVAKMLEQGDEGVAAQRQLAQIRGRTVGDHVAGLHCVANAHDRTLVDAGRLVRTLELGQTIDIDARTRRVHVARRADHDPRTVDLFDHAFAARHDNGAGIHSHDSFHARADQRRIGLHQRHGLTLHVGAHQCAVGVVVLQEGDQGRSDRDHLFGRNVHHVDSVLVEELRFAVDPTRNQIFDDQAVVQYNIGLSDG
ncbi:hypothetical protein LTR94_025474, partial [Friedmanniomyces endolithicus]